MRFIINFLAYSLVFSSIAFSQEPNNAYKVACEGLYDEQLIKLEFFIDDNFKDFPSKKDKIDVDLKINDKVFTETLSYPKYRIEEELNDEGLRIVFLTASLHRGFAQCVFKSCSFKNLSFNIESTNLYEFSGILLFELKLSGQNNKNYNVRIDCHLL
ncbi:MAG: hypothetical protein JNM93_06240 [Bacteriovoracaceae bacterium]|nr:hypothetical protein [Bacteriovoracaceae bacterium]